VLADLHRRGHRAVAVDLPVDPDADAELCAEVVAAAARALPPPVTCVGHSVSGLLIPLVPELAPIDELAFVCTPLPMPGVSLWEQVEREPEIFIRENLQPMQDAADPGAIAREHAIHTYYHDLSPPLAEWAVAQLRPPLPRLTGDPSPLRVWPDVRCRYIVGTNDRIVNPEWARREVPRRLGVTPIEIDSGHSPFLARPLELVEALLMREST
jgi:pimeloyl-ACP methyl ester carboxylesterase